MIKISAARLYLKDNIHSILAIKIPAACLYLKDNRHSILVAACLFLVFSGYDIKLKMEDPFRDFKSLAVLILASIASFELFRKHYGWAVGWFVGASLGFASYHQLLAYSITQLLFIYSTLMAGIFVVNNIPERTFQNAIIACCVVESIWGIANVFGYYPHFKPLNPENYNLAMGTWGQHTILGAFLVAALPIPLWRKNYVVAALTVAACIYCKSSMTMLSLLGIFLIWIWHTTRWANAAFILFLIVMASWLFYAVEPESDLWNLHGRQVIWVDGWRAFTNNPWFGSGLGSWQGLWVPRVFGALDTLGHAPFKMHNEYLQAMVEGGVVLCVPLFYGILQFMRQFKPTWENAVCASVMLNSLGNFPLHLTAISLLFVVALGYSFKSRRVKINQRRDAKWISWIKKLARQLSLKWPLSGLNWLLVQK